MTFRTRFAPSPTGPLHLGHAFSAIVGARLAAAAEGVFLLRIEDIDQTRARPQWETQIFDDLAWLGLCWPRPVMRQSDRHTAYAAALAELHGQGLLYPCACRRRDIVAAAAAPQEGAPLHGPDGIVYPGTCRMTPPDPDAATCFRLDMSKALQEIDEITFHEQDHAPSGRVAIPAARMIAEIGDAVIARRETGTSYHLSVVVDDAAQEITHVVRGRDLMEATPLHRLLQHRLGLPEPIYHHHDLIRDETGKRLAKRDDGCALSTLRAAGLTPDDICRRIGLEPPVIPLRAAVRPPVRRE